MTFVARLRAVPRLRISQWRPAMQRRASPARLSRPAPSSALRLLAWIAAASLAALIAWQVLTHPSSDLSAYGCWSIPDDASACALGQSPTLQDQMSELVAGVLPEHDGPAALARQAPWSRSPGTAAFRP